MNYCGYYFFTMIFFVQVVRGMEADFVSIEKNDNGLTAGVGDLGPEGLRMINDTLNENRLDLLGYHFAGIGRQGVLNHVRALQPQSWLESILIPKNMEREMFLLHEAAKDGAHEAVKEILALSKAYIDLQDHNGMAPLHIASAAGHEAVVQTLLHAGANIKTQTKQNRTPLLCAITNNHLLVAKILLENSTELVNIVDEDDNTPLHVAIQCGHEALVNILLAVPGIILDKKNRDGFTPLHIAIALDNENMVNILMDNPAINFTLCDAKGLTPLHLAACIGRISLVKRLIKDSRVDVNARDRDGKTALYHAVDNGQVDVVKVLLTHPLIDVNLSDGLTPLHAAAQCGNGYDLFQMRYFFARLAVLPDEVVKHFLKKYETIMSLLITSRAITINALAKGGKSIGGNGLPGMTPLHIAVYADKEQMVRILLNSPGIMVNASTNGDPTPLALALDVKPINATIVKLLLLYGSTYNERMEKALQEVFSDDHLMKAWISYNSQDIKRLINNQPERAQEVLLHAAAQGHEEVVKLMLPLVDKSVQEALVEHIKVLLKHQLTPERKKIYQQILMTCGASAVEQCLMM